MYRRAKAAFAARFGRSSVDSDSPPPRPASWTTLDYVLLAYLAAESDEPLPETRAQLYDKVLEHEHGYWLERLAALLSVEPGRVPDPEGELLRKAAACLTLINPTRDRVSAALRTFEELAEDAGLRRKFEDVFNRVLGSTPDEPLAIRPDSVGDHLAITVLGRDLQLLLRLLQHAGPQERTNALENLTRASSEYPVETAAMLAAALEQVDGLWPAAATVASWMGGPLPSLLTRLVADGHPRIPPDHQLAALPLGSITTRTLGETAAREALRRAAAGSPEARAGALGDLAVRLSEVGRRGEALDAIGKAVALYRGLAEANPAAFTPDLATSLNNLANMLSEVGWRDEALAAIGEAVALYRAVPTGGALPFTRRRTHS